MKKVLPLLFALTFYGGMVLGQAPNAWINEFHYDNSGTDAGEFVEIVIENAALYTLSDFRVNLYNGSNGEYYESKTVDNFTVGTTVGNYTFYYWEVPGIQNGPDGIALSYQGTLISGQFLSYEGSFTATNGPANNVTSTDVGVSESSLTSVGYSLQLSGNGTQYSDFIWQNPATATKGSPNTDQLFANTGNTPPSITNISHSPYNPTPSDNVTLNATITDSDGAISNTELHWGISSGSLTTTISMSNGGNGNNYSGIIPPQADGTTVYYNIYAVDNDGASTTSSEQNYQVHNIPKLIITEVMQNPNDVNDTKGEWFELYNYGNSTINIDGYVIKDLGSDSHTINNGGTLNIDPGSFLILGINSDINTNGGVPVDYQYSGITLNNTDDEIILYMPDDVTEVNRVEWDGGTNWPDPTGASMVFTGKFTDNNNDGSKWTTASVRENNYTNPAGTETDKGSPDINGLSQNLILSTTWAGNGNWSKGNAPGISKWSNGSPGKNVSVIINGNVTIDKDATNHAACNNLTINSGKSLTVPMGKAFTVNGNLTNNGTLTVQSDASGNGSLIVKGSVSGSVTVQRYIGKYTSGTGAGNGWHEIGCPVSSMDPAGTNWDPTRNTTDDLYAWSEANNQWVNYRSTTFSFTAGMGYLVANNTDLIHEYTGALNTSDITVTGLTSSAGNGWNLLGNPFPCAIKWNDGNWTLTNIGGVAKIWNESSGNYSDVNPGAVIPSTNGFFVQVGNGQTGSVTIPLAARVHDAANNFKNAFSQPEETLKFKVTNDANGYYDVSSVGFKPNATENFDNAFDSHKLFTMVGTAPSLWSVLKNEQFSANYLPEMTNAHNVPLDFKPGVSTLYHLSVSGVNTFDNPRFILEDTQTGTLIDLSQQTIYDFSADKDDDVNRFVLHINGVTAVPPMSKPEGLQVFSYGKTIVLKSKRNPEGKVSVFNTLGQMVYKGVLPGIGRQVIRLHQNAGLYIVRVEEDDHVIIKKVLIK